MNRLEIKEALKDLKAQYNAQFQVHDMYLKGFQYCGDNIISSDEKYFNGNITTKNLNNSRIDEKDIIKKQVLNEGVNFYIDLFEKEIECYIKVRLIDKWDNIEECFLTIERINL